MLAYAVDGRRVLEVGCGIGLASLVLNEREVDITATDRHPQAGAFMAVNTKLNGAADIPFTRTGWVDDDGSLGEFDLIIGSDLLYEPDHVADLSAFIDRHAEPTSEVILVDPGRGRVAGFTRRMVEFGYRVGQYTAALPVLDPPFRGTYMRYLRGTA